MLHVFLGYRCNLKCSYCLQTPGEWEEIRSIDLIRDFCTQLAPVLIKKNIKKIHYWGGEPFYYWKQLKAIHETLTDLGADIEFARISTNGTIMNEEMVEFLNNNKIHIVVSRHPEFGEPDWSKIVKLDRFSVAYLFKRGDLYAWPHFEELEKLQSDWGRKMYYFAHWVHATDGCDSKFYFTRQDIEDHIAHLYELAELSLRGHQFAADFFLGHLQNWASEITKSSQAAPALCHGDHHINIDLEGKTYACHHSVRRDLQTGHILKQSSPDAQIRAAIRQTEKWVKTSSCQSCQIVSWCKGQCHLSNTHEVDCLLSKRLHEVFSYVDYRHHGKNAANSIVIQKSQDSLYASL